MASCERPELKQKLYRYVRGEIEDSTASDEVQVHLRECPDCQGVYRELDWMLGSLRRTTAEEHAQLLRELTDPPNRLSQDTPDSQAPESVWDRIKRWLARGGANS